MLHVLDEVWQPERGPSEDVGLGEGADLSIEARYIRKRTAEAYGSLAVERSRLVPKSLYI